MTRVVHKNRDSKLSGVARYPRHAFVVFTGRTDLPWLRLLRNGFRHCYIVFHDGRRWITCDPLAHATDIAVHHHLPPDFDLPGWLRTRGNTVIRAAVARPLRPAPCMPFTCVEAVKRVLGLHARFIVTPWQLYRRLGACAGAV